MNTQTNQINPLILTLSINEEAALFFNKQRQQYFPASINYMQAHLTLFHHLLLPVDEIIAQIHPFAAEFFSFDIQVTDVVSLGKGVAYKLESKDLQLIHYRFQQLWKPLLKPQDLQKLWPHITVQNKVTPQQSKDLLAQLKIMFQPFTIHATGLSIWEYLNGPWKFIQTITFSSMPHP